MIAPLLAIVGLVTAVHDGDGPIHVRTATGDVSIRLAGIQAPDFTSAEPCRRHRAEYTCDDAAAARSRDHLASLVLGREVACEPVGRSYQRIVAWCSVAGRDLSCAQVAAGAAVVWDRYWPKGRVCR